MITTVLAFVFTLGVLIVVHEYGHYRVAVACGVKVLRFSVGFGRVLWRRQRGPDATEFVVCALPLGGYVRMLDEREADVGAADLDRAFNRRPLWQRTAIVAAGPVANLLLAVLLFAGAHWIGIDEPKAVLGTAPAGSVAAESGLRAGDLVRAWADDDGDWTELDSLTDLRWQVAQAALEHRDLRLLVRSRDSRGVHQVTLGLGALQAGDLDAALIKRIGLPAPYSAPVLGEVIAGGPAAHAGLRRGDHVLAVDGQPVADAAGLRQRILLDVRGGSAEPMQWRLERDGRMLELTVTPRVVREDGQAFGRIDAYVGTPAEMVNVQRGFADGLVRGAHRTWEVSVLTLRMIGRMLVGEASVKNLSGPLTIADVAGETVQQGAAYYLAFLALVSVSLGVLNLLPLPMLDGGHLMYYLFEGVTGRPVSERWLARLQRGGIAVLLLVMSVALFNDVTRLLGLH